MVSTELGACEWFVFELRRSNLIDRGQLDQIVGEFLKRHPQSDPPALAEHLVEQNLLTPFQAERVLSNKAQGMVLGPYVLTDVLGSGSMGTVYRAISKTDDKEYAVKVLPRRSMWNVRLARRQVRAFGQFSHPAVVPFVDVGTSGGTHYLVWPLIEGETLESVIQRTGRLTPEQTAHLGVQVANALAACHVQSLFHGLLKPSNIMVGPDFRVSILDFGIGSLLAENEGESLVDTMSTSNTLTSGLDCASPESIMEPTNRTPVGDQYSLGCVLYYCASGRYPFAEESAVEKMVAHQMKQPPALGDLAPDAPAGLVAVVERLMQKKPDDRYAGADEVGDRLQPFVGDSPAPLPESPAPRVTPIRPPSRPSVVLPPAKNARPSSIILPPAAARTAPPAAKSIAPSRPSNKSSSVRPPRSPESAPSGPAPVAHHSNPLADHGFVMPPGYVPEQSRVSRYGPLTVAAVGLGAMIVSYVAFMTFNPFK